MQTSMTGEKSCNLTISIITTLHANISIFLENEKYIIVYCCYLTTFFIVSKKTKQKQQLHKQIGLTRVLQDHTADTTKALG